jgi:hypothetical protein
MFTGWPSAIGFAAPDRMHTQGEQLPDDRRSVGGLETMIVKAADSSAASQLHPSQSS